MRTLNDLQTYYMIYNLIREIPRYRLSRIAIELGLSGRGQTKATASKYVTRLYTEEISLHPNLILKAHENCITKAFFLKLRKPEDLTSAFLKLSNNPYISYMLLLSGIYDFFVTTRYELTFDKNLIIKKSSPMYDPIYTHPTGWNLKMNDALKLFANKSCERSRIERDVEDFLPWDEIHFNIFDIMKHNMQIPFSHVARETNLASNTVKKYFYKDILPYCNTAHYFFPKGYSHYHQSLIIVKSDCEKGLVNNLPKLPCTTYVFPLEKEIALILFHEGVQNVMFAMKKLEEKGFIKKHLLLVPLHWE